MTDEEKAAAEQAEREAREAAAAEEAERARRASEAAAELARRRHEAAEEGDPDAPVRMVDLHDLRAELRGDLDALRRAAPVPHAVPEPPASAAQKRTGTGAGMALGVVLIVALLLAALVMERRR